jgi:hypothetical protein
LPYNGLQEMHALKYTAETFGLPLDADIIKQAQVQGMKTLVTEVTSLASFHCIAHADDRAKLRTAMLSVVKYLKNEGEPFISPEEAKAASIKVLALPLQQRITAALKLK